MCSKGGGSPPVPSAASTTFNSTVSPSPAVAPLYTDFLNRASTLSNTPFNPAMLGSVAPLNAEQTAAGGQLFDLGMHMGDFDPAKVTSIMSPFTENVVNTTQDWFNNQNAIQGNDLISGAIRTGNAFGGDRAGVAEGVLAGQQQLAQAPVIAGLRERGYAQALDEYNRLKQFGVQGAGAALGWGGVEQQQAQRERDVAQQNAMMESAYPFQTLNWYGSALGGIGPLMGQTAAGSNNPPGPNAASTALGIGTSAIGLGSAALGAFGSPTDSAGGGRARGGFVGRARGGIVDDDSGFGGREPRGPQLAGDIIYLPIIPGPQAGRPTMVESYQGREQGLPMITPRAGTPAWNRAFNPERLYEHGVRPRGFAFGGDPSTSSFDDSDQDKDSRSRDRDEAPPSRSDQPDYNAPPPRRVARPDFGFGRVSISPHQVPQPVFPNTAGTTQAQPNTIAQGLDLGTKLIGLAGKAAPFFIQRGGGVGHFAYGGDTDDDIMSDASPDPILPGQQYARDYAGRTTWFNPRNESGGYTYRDESGQNWTDTGARALREGPHASGLPSATRGFATPGSSDLGNWFEVNLPGGRKTIAQKTDIGPPGVVDLNAPLASSVGFNPSNVSGRTYVRDLGRNRPPGAGGTQWPDPSKGNTDFSSLPSGEQPSTPAWQVPGAQQGRSPPAAGGPTPDEGVQYGRGQGDFRPGESRTIPGMAKPPQTFAQRWASNPFTQMGANLLAQRSPYFGVNLGRAMLGTMEAQEAQRKQDLLDAKPQMMEHNGRILFRIGDRVTDMGLATSTSETREAAKAARPYPIETQVPGPFGSSTTKKEYYTDTPSGGRERFESPVQPESTGQAPRVIPEPQEPSLPPPQAPQAPQAPQPQRPAPQAPTTAPQVRQTQAAPAAGGTGTVAGDLQRPLEERLAAAEGAAAGPTATPPQWQRDAATGTIRGPDGATYDQAGKQLTPPTTVAPTPQTAQPGQQPAQQQAAAGGPAGPEGTLKRVTDQWGSGVIMPGGQITNPAALNRNEAALAGLSPQEQNQIKGMVDYTLDPNKVFSGKLASLRQPADAKAREYDPNYNPNNLALRAATRKAFEATGVEARNIQAQDMAVQHADTAIRNIDRLNHSGRPWWNEIRASETVKNILGSSDNPYQLALGQTKQDIHAVSNELMKVFRGGTGQPSEKEAKRIADTLKVTDNPEVLKAALREGAVLLYGKVNATAYRYNDAMGPAYARPTESWFSPEGRAAVQHIFQGQ